MLRSRMFLSDLHTCLMLCRSPRLANMFDATTWKVDGATPMYWFIMAPYVSIKHVCKSERNILACCVASNMCASPRETWETSCCVASNMCASPRETFCCIASNMCASPRETSCCVASNMCASARNVIIPTPPHPTPTRNILLRSIKHVCKSERNILLHSIKHVCKSERNILLRSIKHVCKSERNILLPRTCTHVWCYATGCFSRTCTHVWCYATGCFSRTCTHVWCYHLESRWRNSHVLVYHGPLLSHLLGVAPSTFQVVASNMCASPRETSCCVASNMCASPRETSCCIASNMCVSARNVIIPTPPHPVFQLHGKAKTCIFHGAVPTTWAKTTTSGSGTYRYVPSEPMGRNRNPSF